MPFILLCLIYGGFVLPIIAFVYAVQYLGKKRFSKALAAFLVFVCLCAASFLGIRYLNGDFDKTEVQTPNGIGYVTAKSVKALNKAIDSNNARKTESLIKKEPALVYYCNVYNSSPFINATVKGSLDCANVFVEYGARFDSEIYTSKLFHKYALEEYFQTSHIYDSTNAPDIVEFMIKNGAVVNYENYDKPNAFFSAAWWCAYDGTVTDSEAEVFRILADRGASLTAENESGANAYQYFSNAMFMKNIENDNVYKILEMLKNEN